jgi:hypothetical protein
MRNFGLIVVLLVVFAGTSVANDPVIVAGATAADGITIPTTTGTVVRPLSFENSTEKAISIKVEITSLVGPDSQLYAATLKDLQHKDPEPGAKVTFNLPPLEAMRIELRANVPLSGTYQSSLSLIYGGKRYVLPLKIARTSVVPTVRLTGLDSAAFEGCAARSFRFTLQETSGAKVSLRPPVLISLSLKESEKTVQATYQGAKAYLVQPDGSETAITSTLEVPANASVLVRMQVTGLDQPGEYAAALDVGSADGSLPPQAFSIFVKRSVFLAALLIALGVGMSLLIRKYTKVDRPRLLLLRRILLLRTDIEVMRSRLSDDANQALLDTLLQRLDRASGDTDLGITSGVDDVLNDVNGKLSLVPDWSNLRRKIADVAPPSLADAARQTLATAQEFIQSPNNGAADQLKTTADALRNGSIALDGVVRAAIVSQITDAQKAVKDAPQSLSDAHREEFNNEVIAVLSQANDASQKSPPDVGAARKLIDEARRAAGRIMVNDLDEKLVRPDDISVEAWTALEAPFRNAASKVRAATTGDQATAAYRDADAAWLAAMIEAAAKQADAVRTRAAAATEDAKKAYADKMQEVLAHLSAARKQLRNGELATARTTYNDAYDAICEGLKTLPPAPQARSMDGASVVRQPQRWFSLFRSPAIIEIPGLTMSSSAQSTSGRDPWLWSPLRTLEREIARRDRWITFGVGTIAVVLGVFLLWVGNLTWGNAKDLIAAVLWGLGLHQVAGNAVFSKLDVTDLQDQLAGTKNTTSADATH